MHECHVNRGLVNGVLSCYVGAQECRGGFWSACGGSEITLKAVDTTVLASTPSSASSVSTGIGPRAIPVSDSGQCALDPCDPYCVAFNEDGGLTADAGAPTTFTLPGSDIFGGAPGGFAGKSDCGSSAKGCNDVAPGAPYVRKCNGKDHYSIWDSCLADTHCDITRNGGQGLCVADWDTTATADPKWNEATQTWFPAVCPGVDMTITAACEVAGIAGFNICNRGNTTLTAASVSLYLDNGGADFAVLGGGTCPVRAASCSPAVPGGTLGPGKCFRVTNATCGAWSGSGNPVAYVNSTGAIAECGGLLTARASTGPGCNNNFADVKHKGIVCDTTSSFIDSSRGFSYAATCGPATTPKWRVLTYQATVPCSPGACTATNTAKVEFYGTLSRTLPVPATTTEAIISDATTQKTVNCTYGVDAGGAPKCPVDLAAWANSVVTNGASYETLDLRIRLVPTPDNLLSPMVGTWALSYDCVPSE